MSLDILKNEILPLFNQLKVDPKPELNKLIQTEMNELTLYVDLEDVYLAKSQAHFIDGTEYTIPLHYDEIVLSNKGKHGGDLLIKIKTKKHERFLRVNSHDLFVVCGEEKKKDEEKEKEKDEEKDSLTHLDGTEVDLEGHQLLTCLVGRGLPKSDKSRRGDLYVVRGDGDGDLVGDWLNILHYDRDYCNVEIDS